MARLAGWSLVCVVAAVAAGCGGDGGGGDVDAGTTGPGIDAGGSGTDAGGGGGTDAGGGGDGDGGGTPGTDAGGGGGTDGGVPTRTGAVGSACAMDGDCTEPPGSTCQTMVGSGMFSYTFPGGYCTHTCTAGSGSSECGAGADCYSVGFGGFGTAFCAKTCTTSAECREADGYTCQAPPFGGGTTMYCLPPRPGFGGSDGGGFGFPDGGFGFP